MKIEIKHRLSGDVLFAHEAEENSIGVTVEVACEVGANLRGADLDGAYLDGADLGGADLKGADLHGANLGSTDLGGADLHGADLGGANLGSTDLRGADLGGADLRGADLRGASLDDANLSGANLGGASLRGANLRGTNVDFSHGWQFHCNFSRFNIGADFAYQVLAHLCSCTSNDPEFAEIREKILPYAQKSHRAGDLGLLGAAEAEKAKCAGMDA